MTKQWKEWVPIQRTTTAKSSATQENQDHRSEKALPTGTTLIQHNFHPEGHASDLYKCLGSYPYVGPHQHFTLMKALYLKPSK